MATAKTPSTEVVAAEPVSEVVRTKRVVIQRPFGNSDSHIFLGFNSFEGSFPFDQEVELPADMVDYLRSQKRAEFRPDENGRPLVSYSALLSIVDA